MLLPWASNRSMKVFFSAVDGTQDNAFSLDLDPARLRGSRSAFGAQLQVIGLLEYDRNKAVPLQIGGILAWHADGVSGLHIPSQSVGNGGTIGLAVSIADGQLAGLEERRAGGEPNLTLSLNALGRQTSEGTVSYRASWSPVPYLVPRDRWADAIAACGFGRIHIVELPVPTVGADAWSRSAQMLARGSADFGKARYGEAMGNVRNALQELVAVLERDLAIEPKTPVFAERIKELAVRLTALHERRGADPYGVMASLIRAVFDFSSDPVHRGYDLPNREDASFALSLATSLHAFLARRPLPKPLNESEAEPPSKA